MGKKNITKRQKQRINDNKTTNNNLEGTLVPSVAGPSCAFLLENIIFAINENLQQEGSKESKAPNTQLTN